MLESAKRKLKNLHLNYTERANKPDRFFCNLGCILRFIVDKRAYLPKDQANNVSKGFYQEDWLFSWEPLRMTLHTREITKMLTGRNAPQLCSVGNGFAANCKLDVKA